MISRIHFQRPWYIEHTLGNFHESLIKNLTLVSKSIGDRSVCDQVQNKTLISVHSVNKGRFLSTLSFSMRFGLRWNKFSPKCGQYRTLLEIRLVSLVCFIVIGNPTVTLYKSKIKITFSPRLFFSLISEENTPFDKWDDKSSVPIINYQGLSGLTTNH